MPLAPVLRTGGALLIVLLGGGLIVYGIIGKPPPIPEDCHEMTLDPDPDQAHPGTLQLSVCPDKVRTRYSLQITDYWRNPPVMEWVFSGTLPADSAVVPLRSHWVTPDSLVLEYHPALHITHRADTAGPIHLTWIPQAPAH
jgi:hypothetical protein